MKLKKFQKRYKELVGTKQLQAAGFDAPKFLKRGILIFAGLALVLSIFFIAAPSYWGFWRRNDAEQSTGKYKNLSYELKNYSNRDWKGIKLYLEGTGLPVETSSARLISFFSDDQGFTAEFNLGDLGKGESKSVSVNINSETPGSFEYYAVFKDSSGKVIRTSESTTLEFTE